jgi:hypothetical protein
MGIEIQGGNLPPNGNGGDLNLDVEDNQFANWTAPYQDSFGLSIVPTNGPNVVVKYNTLLGRPPVPGTWTDRFGFGIELGGDNTCTDNLTEGYFWNGIVIGGANTTVYNNVLRGPPNTNGGYVTPTNIALEPGSDSSTDTIGQNVETITASYIENPTNLTANVSATSAALSWQLNSTNQTGIYVERRIPGSDYAVIATLTATATTYTDSQLTSETNYVYRIEAFDSAGDITYSPSLLVSTPAP